MEIGAYGPDRRAHNPLVGGSSPPGPTIFFVTFQQLVAIFGHGAVDYQSIGPRRRGGFPPFPTGKIPDLTKLFPGPRWNP